MPVLPEPVSPWFPSSVDVPVELAVPRPLKLRRLGPYHILGFQMK